MPTQESIKLVFVNRYFDPDQSATSQLLTDLARGLAARGLRVHVVCCRQLYLDRDAKLPSHETISGVTIHRVATTSFGRGRLLGRAIDYASYYLATAWALVRMLDAGDVLVALTDPPLISILAAPIARLRKARLVNWQQDVFPEVASQLGANPLPRRLDRLLRRARNASMRGAAMNVLISERMSEYFAHNGVPASQLCVIENWADPASVTPKPVSSSALRARLGLVDRFVVCYSGNLGRAHEFDTFLVAAEELRADRSIAFLMIGGGAKMEELQRLVDARKLENFVFLPYQAREDLGDSLAAADIHLVSLLPTLEGLIMPSKLYGILAAGRPAIFIGDVDGDVARVIRGARCGSTVPIGASNDLVELLRIYQRDPETRAAMGERARDLLLGRYTMGSAIEKWSAVPGIKPAHPNAAAALPRPSDQ